MPTLRKASAKLEINALGCYALVYELVLASSFCSRLGDARRSANTGSCSETSDFKGTGRDGQSAMDRHGR